MRVCLKVLVLLITLIGFSWDADSHEGAVGLVQAKLNADEVTVLLKFKSKPLLEALYGPESGVDIDALAQVEGRNKLLDLLTKTHSVSTEIALCERDKIARFEPTPSRGWFDVIIHYRCPLPRQKVEVRVATLLDGPKHHLVSSFEAEGELTKTHLTRRRPAYTFKSPRGLPGNDEARASVDQGSRSVFLSLFLFFTLPLIPLVARGSRSRRVAGLGLLITPLLMGGYVILGPTGAGLTGLVGLVGVGIMAVRLHFLERDLHLWDLFVAFGTGGSLAMCLTEVGYAEVGACLLGAGLGLWLGELRLKNGPKLVGFVCGVAVVLFSVEWGVELFAALT